jgi:hypothetical protein
VTIELFTIVAVPPVLENDGLEELIYGYEWKDREKPG